jgi:hypothetical protein
VSLFGKRRNRRRLAALADGPEGIAVIRAAQPVGELSARTGPETILNLEPNVMGTHAYWFTLEVRIPGHEAYEVSGQFDVPKKAENISFFDTANALKPGIELPVRVDPNDGAKVAVDWDRFLASPGRKQSVKAAKEAGQRANVAQQVAKNPKMQAKMWANNRQAVQAWAAAVRAGSMSRDDFERTVTQTVESGRMDPADAQAARQALDDG